MSQSTILNRPKRIVARWVVLAVALVGPLAVSVMTAQAADMPATGATPAFTTAFEIDGDKDVDGTSGAVVSHDWGDVVSAAAATAYTTPEGFASTGIVDSTSGVDNGSGDASCQPGGFIEATGFPDATTINTDPWVVGPAAAANTGDACTGGAAYEIVRITDGGQDQLHYVLYQYWTRLEAAENLEVFQLLEGPAAGRGDDVLLGIEYDASLDAISDIRGHFWDGGSWVVDGNFLFDAATGINTDVVQASGQDGTFGESAIDLTSAGVIPEDECVEFSTSGFVTRTGGTDTSELVDSLEFPEPLVIDTCSDIEVTKQANATTDAEFTYVLDQADGNAVHDTTRAVTGGGDDTDGATTSITSTIRVGETHTWSNVIAQSDYQLDETVVPAGWELGEVECTWWDPFSETVVTEVVTDSTGILQQFPIPPSSVDNDTTTSCVLANDVTQVVVTKDVVPNSDTGLFDLSINGVQVVDDGGDGASSAPVQVAVGDVVTVSEGAGTGTTLANYAFQLTCDSGVAPNPNTGTAGTFTVPASASGSTITCVFRNTRRSAELVLTKDWVDGFTGDVAQLTASGDSGNSAPAQGTSVAPNTDDDANMIVWAGETVTLSEVLPDANVGGYATELACQGGGLTYESGDLAGTYVVGANPFATLCTFTNTRTSATLDLDKAWVNGAAGDTADIDITATLGQDPPGGATATANGSTGTFNDDTQVTATVFSGETVTLDEELADGNLGAYDPSLSCDAVGLDPDLTEATSGSYTMPKDPAPVVCTFTNTRTSVELALQKTWVDADGGDQAELAIGAQLADAAAVATSTADGGVGTQDDVANQALATVLSGETVTLSEAVVDEAPATAYDTSLACGAQDLGEDRPAEFTVPKDVIEDITCTVTNEAGRGTIVIVKNVAGADGTFDFTGDWIDDPSTDTSVGDFQLTTDGGTVTQTWADVPVDGGPFTVTETDSNPAYDAISLECVESGDGADGGSSADGLTGTIDLDDGETVTCTYTNTQRGKIIVIKDAQPDNDQPFQFTTTGDGFAVDDEFSLVDDGSGTDSEVHESGLLPANTDYSVAETPVAGWELTSATCSDDLDDLDPAGFTLAPGATVTCTFVSQAATGAITMTTDVTGVGDDLAWSFDIAIDPVEASVTSPQTLAGVGPTSESVIFDTLLVGSTYTISEPVVSAGWEQASLECDVDDDDAGQAGYQVTIAEADPAVDCTIVTSARPSQVEVTTTVAGVADDQGWSFDFGIAPATDGEDAIQTASGTGVTSATVGWATLVPGDTYTITEAIMSGFAPGVLTCEGVDDQDLSPTSVTFTAPLDTDAQGPEVTCAMTNVRRGDLSIDKQVTSIDDDVLGEVTVTYDLVVTSGSLADEPYDLTDELLFGEGVEVAAAMVASADVATSTAWNGRTDLVVTDGTPVLPAGATHTFTVTVTATVAVDATDSARDCDLVEGEDGTGLLNQATVTYAGGTDTDDDCDQVAATPMAELPRTGADLDLLGLLAALFLMAGLAVREVARARSLRP